MQNYDFYSGKIVRDIPPYFNREDPEYFARLANIHSKEEHRKFKRASRILSMIFALCIISFTAGLIIGIKFASGSNKELMDRQTKEAVTDIGQKVTTLINDTKNDNGDTSVDKKKLFAKEEFPFVIRIGEEYNKSESQEIATIISSHGHTVILSKNNNNYKVFVGPYKNQEKAQESLKMIKSYPIKGDAVIIKR